jgi:hypothetical protein
MVPKVFSFPLVCVVFPPRRCVAECLLVRSCSILSLLLTVRNYRVYIKKRVLSQVLQNKFGSVEVVLRTQEVRCISLVPIYSVVQHGNRWRCDPKYRIPV